MHRTVSTIRDCPRRQFSRARRHEYRIADCNVKSTCARVHVERAPLIQLDRTRANAKSRLASHASLDARWAKQSTRCSFPRFPDTRDRFPDGDSSNALFEVRTRSSVSRVMSVVPIKRCCCVALAELSWSTLSLEEGASSRAPLFNIPIE